MAAAAAAQHVKRSLKAGWEAKLDACFHKMLNNARLDVPGIVVLAKRGDHTYEKAFGFANKETKTPMMTDAQFRIFSMTKVLTTTLALMLEEKGALSLDDTVGKHIPSFDRPFEVLVDEPKDSATAESVKYTSFLSGKTHELRFSRRPAAGPLLVKHLCAESSGIGYDQWADVELMFPGAGFGTRHGAAQVLRGRGAFSSNQIIGQDQTVEEYCDAIAGGGVLVSDPGTFSYGLGALVLGRVVETSFAQHTGEEKKLSEIMREWIFAPLGMDTAAFYLPDGDVRALKIPELYGAKMPGADGRADVVPYAASVPSVPSLPITVATDNASGPRSCESGDTGLCMTAQDFSRFYEMLMAKGKGPGGKDAPQVLSETLVRRLTHGSLDGLDRSGNLCERFGLTGRAGGDTMNFGWAKGEHEHEHAGTKRKVHVNYWSGYANNHGRVWVDEESYILLMPQLMGSSPGGWILGGPTIRDAALKTFLELWTWEEEKGAAAGKSKI